MHNWVSLIAAEWPGVKGRKRNIPGKEETKGVPSYAPAFKVPPRKDRVAARLLRKTKEGKHPFLV